LNRPRPLRAEAPAKINRELRVGLRRADGFHEIRSRFAAIDLADSLEAEEAPELSLVCEGARVAEDRSNLVIRAALALAEKLGRSPGARLKLVKRIPVGAGLGGGSSDAALALRLLARLWDVATAVGELGALAADLRSDVPFFLSGGEADVAGRGERILPRDDARAVPLVLLVPPFPIGTADAYTAFDRMAGARPLPERLDIEASGRFFGPNELEPAAVAVRPEMGRYLDAARALAREASVTGSGSAIVLAGAAPDAAARLARRCPETRILSCRTLTRREYEDRTAISELI
jgi:4-diphosphocytidyl-2-C-methyl-D-erythritol kinase